jgi:hypothetical protein
MDMKYEINYEYVNERYHTHYFGFWLYLMMMILLKALFWKLTLSSG